MQFEEGNNAISITNGNFHWGVTPKQAEKAAEKSKPSEIEEADDKEKPLLEKKSRGSIGKDMEEEDVKTTINEVITLRNINLEVKHGEFVCIIGDVGSGKSSLLSAMIGDMLHIDKRALDKYGN